MVNEKPFIHALRTPLGYYIYDVNTNMLVGVDKDTYQFLWEVERHGDVLRSVSSEHINQNIAILCDQGFLSSKRPKEIRHSYSDLVEYYLNDNIMQIALQVTQQCNFRCSYCAYCASDFEFQREHSSKKMTVETALAAIDFFAERCGDQEQPTIGFYGGEPLLEFQLIQLVTEYAEKKLYGKDIRFNITTNASLLTVDIARFLLKHNFMTTISLDGTPETHDRSRRFAGNGKGSFSVIRRNLDNVREQCPEFKYSFNAVVDPRYSCEALHCLFNQDEFFQETAVALNLIDDRFSIEKTVPGENYLQEDSRYTFKSYLAYRGVYDKKRSSRLAHEALYDIFNTFKTKLKPSTFLPDVTAPGGPCIPGQQRLFVSVDGNFYPCERVSETSPAMNIGNLWDGFDFRKIDRIINIAQITAERCKNCWAFRQCTLCGGQCDNNGELSVDLRCSQCREVRAQAEDLFKDYLWVKEFGVSEEILNLGG